jgi:hypothetical protein
MSEPTENPEPNLPASSGTVPQQKPRFSWPMRIFLSVLLFDMFFRCFAILYPWQDWRDEMKMTKRPRRFLTPQERVEWARDATADDPHPVLDRTLLTFDSIWDFFKPWPEAKVRSHLRTPEDAGKFALCWLNTRLSFLENLIGAQQGWAMFSPGVNTCRRVNRARLRYADGSERIVRTLGDPEDPTHFFRFGSYRVRSHQMEVTPTKDEECFGYCNLLRFRYAENENGSRLQQIRLYRVLIEFTPPRVDPREFLQGQMALLRDSTPSIDGPVFPDFYEFNPSKDDPEKWVGTTLKK